MLPDFNLSAYANSCNVKNPGKFTENCRILHAFLEEYNTHVNLTRLTSPEDFCYKHVCDSLSIANVFPEIAEKPLAIADIGCGAGFPSLILAAAFPQLKITAIDSIGKKITFVKLAAEKLQLNNLTAIHGRSNELNCKVEFQRKFDIVTARAVAPSPKIYREASKFVKPDGRFIFYKTPIQAAEETELLDKIKEVKWVNTPVFTLPGAAGERLFTTGKIIHHK
jgi:16S rRNA (guanine527-N7)-methyltransferase